MITGRVLLGTLVVGVVIGLVIGSAGPSLFGLAGAGASTPTESLSFSSGTGCGPAPQSTGWVGQQPIHDVMAVSFNYTVAHETTAVDVNASLDPSANGDYFLRIETSPDRAASAKKGPAPEGCQPRTTIDASMTVPRDYDTITVVVDGERVTTIENTDSSFARYRPVHGTS